MIKLQPLMTKYLRWLGIGCLGWVMLLLSGCDSAPPPTLLDTAKQQAKQCVEPTAVIRSQHMSMLMHQRDATVIEGIRTRQHSLQACINCHVAPTKADGSPLHYGDKEHFCTTCHAYVGTRLDCFQCHVDRPQIATQADYLHKLGSQHPALLSQVQSLPAPTATEVNLVVQKPLPPLLGVSP